MTKFCLMCSFFCCCFFSRNAGCCEADDQPAIGKERFKPIDYFIQYFSWSTWRDIAACTQNVSKLQNPITELEVAKFVGIHIAMGTLKVSNNIQSDPLILTMLF